MQSLKQPTSHQSTKLSLKQRLRSLKVTKQHLLIAALIVVLGAVLPLAKNVASSAYHEVDIAPALKTSSAPATPAVSQASIAKATPKAGQGVCGTNYSGKKVVVSISQQHFWACDGTNQVYDTAVTTGASSIGDATPTGTWQINSKVRDTHLTGPGYDDFVQYWMPFYSDYGFHDASWQTFPFGSPQYTTDGSHGCVHLPTPAMAWFYNWAAIGTTVTINA